ncbi:MAG: glycoside hydrolase family 1 [Opitutae bacterium]|nr:glycoside hydrolase family 1 [Opitutae bacterium]
MFLLPIRKDFSIVEIGSSLLLHDMANKVLRIWRESRDCGLVALDRDWNGEPIVDFPSGWQSDDGAGEFFPLSPTERGSLCGYARQGDLALFLVEPILYPFLLRSGTKAFLAAPFNEWEKARLNDDWLLTPREDGLLGLERPWGEVASLAPFSFKFINGDGAWINPPEDAPNVEESKPGARNFIFRKDRAQRDLLRFSIPSDFASESIDELAERLIPEGWFGVRLESGETRFRLFAPRANEVTVDLSKNLPSFPSETHSLVKDETGAWQVNLPNDLSGWFYSYQVEGSNEEACTDFNQSAEVLDPYALAAVGPAGPGIVLDPSTVESFITEPFVSPSREDLVIVEVHVRDLLAKASLELTPSERLGFSGLSKWISSDDCYLLRLGANAVELQPILEPDAETVDEYFWGYMPVNFFAPASHYSLNPEQASGIREFQEVVSVFHDKGMAVILDLVYNHVGVPNHLARLDKGLYFATDKFGRLTNHSGCGNDLRHTSSAARRLVIDSLKHLVRTFDVDGFRLDLAELLGIDFLREIERELLPIKPNLHLIAEPWSFRGRLPDVIRETSYSLWGDDLREGLLDYARGSGDAASVLRWLQGSFGSSTARPSQTVNYVESHDDYAFIDRLTERSRRNGSNPTELDIRRHRLALAVLLASPGIPMLSAGQDFLRSKKGVRNTYLRGDLNALDYSLLEKSSEHHEYIRDWIALRLSEVGQFLRPAEHPPKSYYQSFMPKGGMSLALIINADKSQGPRRLFFAVNSSPNQEVLFPEAPEGFGDAVLVANSEKVSKQGLQDTFFRKDGCLCLPSVSTAMWAIS